MQPKLVVGLGNDYMGDEGVGAHVAAALFGDGRLPEDTEVRWGRTKLDLSEQELRSRKRIVVIHALLDDLEPGQVEVVEGDEGRLWKRATKIPFLPERSVERFLRAKRDCSAAAQVAFVAVVIDGDEMTSELSSALDREVPIIVDRVLDELI